MKQTELRNSFTTQYTTREINYGDLTKKYVSHAKQCIASNLDNSIHITLPQYLINAMNDQTKVQVNQVLLYNVGTLFNQEFTAAKYITSDINNKYDVELNSYHACDIAILLIAAEFGISTSEVLTMLTLTLEMIKLVKYRFMFNMDMNNISVHSFIEHVKYLSFRIIRNQKDRSSVEDWIPTFKKKYRIAYESACEISEFIKNKYAFSLSDTELLFLSVHIHTLIYGEVD